MNTSTTYVDGFVLPLPKDKIEAYRAMSQKAAIVWKDHGALDYRECIGDDMNIEGTLSFPAMMNTQPDEIPVFAWITYKSREHRDEVNKKVMADPRLECDPENMPFDCKRMAYGGFKTLVEI